MKTTGLSTGEKELQESLDSSGVPVVVLLGEPFHPGARLMSERARRAVLAHPPVKLVEITLSAHRDWAARHGVHGTPALLLFEGRRKPAVVLGSIEEELLLKLLREVTRR